MSASATFTKRQLLSLAGAGFVAQLVPGAASAEGACGGLPEHQTGGQLDRRAIAFAGEKFAAVREMATALSPSLATETDRLGVALTLRDQIYWHVPMEATPANRAPWADVDRIYRESVIQRRYGHECGGRVILFLIALRAFGIPSRYIGLFSTVDNVTPQTMVHASSEVLIDRQWIVLDAHYNISLRDECGGRIGWTDAHHRLNAGRKVIVASDGARQNPAITIGHYLDNVYKKTLKELASFIDVSIYYDGSTVVHSRALAPADWNGTVKYSNGSVDDVVADANTDIYAVLAKSWPSVQ